MYWLILLMLVNDELYAKKVAQFSTLEQCITFVQEQPGNQFEDHMEAVCMKNAPIKIEQRKEQYNGQTERFSQL